MINASALPPARQREASYIDKNKDGVLSEQEVTDYLVQTDSLPHEGEAEKCDKAAILAEFTDHLQMKPSNDRGSFPTYEQISHDLDQLAGDHPNVAQKVSLGKTHEGRDIWALKVSQDVDKQDTSQRTGVVITGGTHAREWIAPQIPLALAHEMVENAEDPAMQKRLHGGETWIVPLVNPDGYEYSLANDGWWRKNRNPQPSGSIGVDNDRNYWDGTAQNFELWRPAGDTPGSVANDYSMTSDDPDSDVYRGPSGASEAETRAVLKLELGHQNIRGVIDHHSYGDLILYPWGHSSDPVPNKELFVDIGNAINAAMDNTFSVEQSAGLYPDSGESDDTQYVNGIVPFILETGSSFHPKPDSVPATCELLTKGNLAFIDQIQERAAAGTLPERTPWNGFPDEQPPAPPQQPPAPPQEESGCWIPNPF